MKRLSVCLLCLASAAAAAEAPEDFAYAVPIEGVTSDALYRVAIPRVVHEATAFPDLRDLRVFNGKGEVVPHALRPSENAGEAPAPVALPFYALQGPRGARVEDLDVALENVAGRVSLKVKSRYTVGGQWGRLGYLVDATQIRAPLSGLEIDWVATGDDYLAAVRVEGSDDLRLWTSLGVETHIFSIARGPQHIVRGTVEYDPARAKYLRLSWKDPARVVELRTVLGVVAERGAAPARVWKRVVAKQDATRSGDFLVDAGGFFPFDRLALRLPQEDSMVPIEVLSRAGTADAWSPVGRTLAFRLKRGEIELASPDVAFTPNPHRYWLLRADESGGGVGAESLIVRAGWIPREIIFAPRGAAPFSLAYGNARAGDTAIPIATLVPGWRPEQAATMRTAATGAPRGRASAAAAEPRVDTERASLWAALTVGVATLVWLSWRRRREKRRAEGEAS